MLKKRDIRFILLGIYVLFSACIYAQECDLVIEKFKDKIINNYAGFSGNLSKESFLEFIRKVKKSKSDCLEKLKQIQFFFQDNHLSVFLYNQQERYSFKKGIAEKFAGDRFIEGVWLNEKKDKIIRIKRIKKNNYEAVVLSSKNKRVKDGLVLYEMKLTKYKTWETTVNNIGRSYFGIAKINSLGELVVSYFDKWKKVKDYKADISDDLKEFNPYPALVRIDSQTVLIKVPECSFEAISIMDSLLANGRGLLNASRNIIIDLRENSGGTILALESLLPYLGLTMNISEGASIVCSEDNLLSYEDDLKFLLEANIKPEIIGKLKVTIDSIRRNLGKIYYRPHDTTLISPFWKPSEQKKIGVIINYRTASAAELFVLKAIRSSYVTLFGEKSAGALYTLEATPYFIKDSSVEITIPMVKKDLSGIKKLTADYKISPDVELTSSDWFMEVKQYLQKNGKN